MINLRIYQMGQMCKYIDSSIALTIYKQVVLTQLDADFMSGRARKSEFDKLEKL